MLLVISFHPSDYCLLGSILFPASLPSWFCIYYLTFRLLSYAVPLILLTYVSYHIQLFVLCLTFCCLLTWLSTACYQLLFLWSLLNATHKSSVYSFHDFLLRTYLTTYWLLLDIIPWSMPTTACYSIPLSCFIPHPLHGVTFSFFAFLLSACKIPPYVYTLSLPSNLR